jgi:hypothetical protein
MDRPMDRSAGLVRRIVRPSKQNSGCPADMQSARLKATLVDVGGDALYRLAVTLCATQW